MAKKDSEVLKLKRQILRLKKSLAEFDNPYRPLEQLDHWLGDHPHEMPKNGTTPLAAKEMIENNFSLDFKPKLNTSSYVNVHFEKEAEELAVLGLKVNLADQTVYPQSFKMHNSVINMLAHLWHCPENKAEFNKYQVFAGAGTTGSTEACLLAGLALRSRWRQWYRQKFNISKRDVLAIRPNIIISSCFQAAWEKFFKYMDVDCKIIPTSTKSFKLDPKLVAKAIDEKTIGVVCILGNHYGGHYDRVDLINDVIEKVNKKKGYQVGIHVDAASGGFIAPFQKNMFKWDFRLKNVLSISASGHKYGEACCGTGWVVWRQRKDLSEHIAIDVTYLGGCAESYTLNFSRPASGVFVQYYNFIRYGFQGYNELCSIMMAYAKKIRDRLKKMKYKGKSRFIILDDGDSNCLPVVTAMLNPACKFNYNDIDLQNALSQYHWYVSGYQMSYEDPFSKKSKPIFTDYPINQTMFRIVIKANINESMVQHLIGCFDEAFKTLDQISKSPETKLASTLLRPGNQIITKHC